MISLDDIRPYLDEEVPKALNEYKGHPIIKALFKFALPGKHDNEIDALLSDCDSIQQFQEKIIHPAVSRLLEQTTEGLSTSGFDDLQKDKAYLFISNHRDIILDTTLTNMALFEHGMGFTASAIGDNLVKKPFLKALARLNRNFIIHRSLGPRETLESSRLVSQYIADTILNKGRSVWIAQREGRTKDGNDRTQQGVLKMLGLASEGQPLLEHLKELHIVPLSISYEFDPTDMLKMPELLARHYEEEYIKTVNEDFNSIMKGALGQKKRIHIAAGQPLDQEIDALISQSAPLNKQLKDLASIIDRRIHQSYALWPPNYIAFDLLNGTHIYSHYYSDKEVRQFMRRMERRIETSNHTARLTFLLMYAYPILNRLESK